MLVTQLTYWSQCRGVLVDGFMVECSCNSGLEIGSSFILNWHAIIMWLLPVALYLHHQGLINV